MKYFAERLKAARKMKGWSLQELAGSMENEISKQALSKYETGVMKPNSEVLIQLCRVLGVSSDYFSRETSISLEKVSFRKLKKLSMKEQESVISQTVDFVERYLELEEILGIKEVFDDITILKIPINSPSDIEQAAERVREVWHLGTDPLYNVIELLEDHKIKVFEVNADYSFSGMSTWIDKKIPVIVLNSSDHIPPDRKRFTALHELGHLLLDLDQYDEKTQEKYCNCFAGAILIPRLILETEIGGVHRDRIFINELSQLKLQYGISIQALIYRIHDLGYINDSYHKFLVVRFSQLGYRQHEPVEYQGLEKSNRFLQLLLRGVAEELLSTSKAAALNNQKLAEFRPLLA